MPALWPQFITNVTNAIAGQQFTDPGSIPPRDNIDPTNPNYTIPTYVPFATPSGRRDFGEYVAQEYLNAVKFAQTPIGALHQQSPTAQIFIKAYGEIFERLYRIGDLQLMDEKDADGNITKMGKESHPAYEDLCPDPIEPPDPIEEEKKQQKKFDAFIDKYKNDSTLNLHKFTYFEFPCLDGTETQEDLKQLFATRLLMKFSRLQNADKRWRFFEWIDHLGDKHYKNMGTVEKEVYGGNFPNIHEQCRTDIENAGYNWSQLVNSVSGAVTYWILESHPAQEQDEDLEVRIRRPRTSDIQYPPKGRDICELNEWKIQVSWNREHDLPDYPSKRPKILTDMVVATFTWVDGYRENMGIYTTPRYKKKPNWVETRYVNVEYETHWVKQPNGLNNVKSPEDIIALSISNVGTLFKFQRQQVIDELAAAEECDANESDPEIDFDFTEGDPYLHLADATILYWYSCLVQPFKPMPASPPALLNVPLGGIYIPIYYGGRKRLANNLRRALNTGKSFSQLPVTQPPAVAVATALAATYAMHLLEFKLIYLGGIPTPVGPVPMVGFVPVVF